MKKNIFLISAVSLMVILSGCLSIDVYHKFKRNGRYDLGITFESDNSMILGAMKEGFKADDSVKDFMTYSETKNSFTYSFRDLDPDKGYIFFKEGGGNLLNTSGGLPQGASYPGMSDKPMLGFLDKENIEFTKELRFPYYVYTYRLKYKPGDKEGGVNEKTPLDLRYIIDDAGILNEATEKQLLTKINEVYMNDSVETVVYTTDEVLSSFDRYGFLSEFREGFKFREEGGRYIIIFAYKEKTWNGSVVKKCVIDHNIYFGGGEITSGINDINDKLENDCRDNYGGMFNAVNGLHELFMENDLEDAFDKQMNEQLGSMFKVGYIVETFGEVTETNGLMLGDGRNKVRFDINLMNEGEYYLRFRDLFIASWLGACFGEAYIYVLGLGMAVVLAAAIFLVYRRRG